MPGNERHVIEYLSRNISTINLRHLGYIKSIQIPIGDQLFDITTQASTLRYYSDDANKKADVYINGDGVSIKQTGGSVLYNKIQRKAIIKFFASILGKDEADQIMGVIDSKVDLFVGGIIPRDVRALDIISQDNLYEILKPLMLQTSLITGKSRYPADYILVAQKVVNSSDDLQLLDFNEFFDDYKNDIVFALRRCWVGQYSNSESNRAKAIMKHPLNMRWVYEQFLGKPRGWDNHTPHGERREVIYINININR